MVRSEPKTEIINPIYNKEDSVTVVFSFDEEFCKYFSVTLQSIIDNANHYTKYDLIILYSQIAKDTKEKLYTQLPENFSLRFFDMPSILSGYFPEIELNEHGRWPREVFYRLFIPLMMRKYKKVLYLDSDLVSEIDIQDLYKQKFDGKKLIAIKDTAAHLFHIESYQARKYYMKNDLGIEDETLYFNSGVLLFNIEAIEPTSYRCTIKKDLKTEKLLFPDQDLLNKIFQNDVKFISKEWNYCCGEFIYNKYFLDMIDDKHRDEILKAKATPKIIHYTSTYKPWNSTLKDHFNRFWHSARKSPFYEELLLEKTLEET